MNGDPKQEPAQEPTPVKPEEEKQDNPETKESEGKAA
jgi:hypothetical protein